jgi:glycosyltransferase involved in cell wall biosynthesis
MPAASPRRAVHQLLASLSYGDAIGNEALVIRDLLRAEGFDSDIFAEQRESRLAHEARPLADYDGVVRADTVAVFHFSIGSAASTVAFHAPHRLGIVYHNITPASSFARFHPHLARLCHEGRRELAAFAPRTEVALADSEYNRRELVQAGYRRTAVLPLVLDLASYDGPRSPVVRRLYGPERRNVVFVGRVIPSKRIEDLIRAFAVFQRHVERKSRLLVVGDYRGHERYLSALQALVGALKLRDVVFTGRVEAPELRAYFGVADAFLGLSEHEGFCAPLLEAMLYEVPVVACEAGAVEETLDGAGLLLHDRAPERAAEALGLVIHDPKVRAAVLASQTARVARLRALDFRGLLRDRLAPLLAGAPAAAVEGR